MKVATPEKQRVAVPSTSKNTEFDQVSSRVEASRNGTTCTPGQPTSKALCASASAALRSFTSWRSSLRWPWTSSSVFWTSLSCGSFEVCFRGTVNTLVCTQLANLCYALVDSCCCLKGLQSIRVALLE